MILTILIALAAIAAIELYAIREQRAQRRRHGGLLKLDTPSARKALRDRRPW